jgi:glutamyl-tRNA reductase
MELLCLGLNHRTAPVEVRERFAVGTKKLGATAHELVAMTGGSEALVISTCNRTEFYLVAPDARLACSRLETHLAEKTQLDAGVAAHFYRLERSAAARHLCRVVSGLDSMLLGETEIFGQVKQAYQAALEAGATAAVLNRLFQRAFGVGKKVRTETSIQQGSTSVGNVAVDLAEKIFGHLKDSEVMILGAGEMSRITAQSLVSRGARSIFVANRSFDRAQELAIEMGGCAVRFDEWQKVLERVDVVISSTGCPFPIVHPADVEQARHARKFRPLFFIDIAVPRDIDPAVGDIEEVYLYDIDTLEQLADQARGSRQLQIEECERIIDTELAKFNLPGTRPEGR